MHVVPDDYKVLDEMCHYLELCCGIPNEKQV